MRNYRNYTDLDIATLVPKVTSLSQLLKELGLKSAGGNFVHIDAKLAVFLNGNPCPLF